MGIPIRKIVASVSGSGIPRDSRAWPMAHKEIAVPIEAIHLLMRSSLAAKGSGVSSGVLAI